MDLISTIITDQSPREDSGLEREDKNRGKLWEWRPGNRYS